MTTLAFFIQHLMVGIKLARHWKFWDQINTIEMLGTKLKYDVKDRNQCCNLS